MQGNRNLFEELKHQFSYGTMTAKLLLINVFVFFIIQLVVAIFKITLLEDGEKLLSYIFTLNTNLRLFIFSPWGLITSIFSHFSFLHFLMNMLFLYFSGQFFERIFDSKRLLYTYILGGICGGLVEILSHLLFPGIQTQDSVVVGASGSIMAIFAALAFYRPNTSVMVFSVFPLPIYVLALLFLLNDIIGLGNDHDNTAHFAHLGGMIFGVISVLNVQSNANVMNGFYAFLDRIKGLFSGKSKPNKSQFSRPKTDEEYNMERKKRQEKTDAILDKISKSGYDSLTRDEKDFLFNQSKK
ncbi:MAG: hypothetical protein RL264_52 [Bacteroidota bacterium]|jgi:membrane associated rhomboid family serine protease